jgi:hypothetical protein
LVEDWSGKSWAIEASPTPSSATVYAGLVSVSCPARGSCSAVGSYVSSVTTLPFAERS